jgi:hypothetical protein
MQGLEELKKQFIVEKNVELENVKELIERLSKFCKVDTQGYLFVINRDLIQRLAIKDKILLGLSARYLASKLEENILSDVSTEELAKFFSERNTAINSRAKELKDQGKIIVKERGRYSINPYQIDDFIRSIEAR